MPPLLNKDLPIIFIVGSPGSGNNEMTLLSGRGIEEVISTSLVDPAPIQVTQQPLNAQIDVQKLIRLLRETAPKQKKNCMCIRSVFKYLRSKTPKTRHWINFTMLLIVVLVALLIWLFFLSWRLDNLLSSIKNCNGNKN
uniref:Glucuronosyltransferase n=1 Tax=Meloidogyne javanica TaxID=6303 RepID=A0A915NEH5_MELJA